MPVPLVSMNGHLSGSGIKPHSICTISKSSFPGMGFNTAIGLKSNPTITSRFKNRIQQQVFQDALA
jgi:hypothetical protein